MEPIRLEVNWTKEDAVWYAVEGKLLNWRFLLWAISCLVLGIAALIIQFTFKSDNYILIIGLAGVVIPIAFIIMTVNGARASYDSRPQVKLPVRYEISKEGVKRESEAGTKIFTPKEIHAVACMKRFIAIAISPKEAYVLPKRCIPNGEEGQVMELLRKFEDNNN